MRCWMFVAIVGLLLAGPALAERPYDPSFELTAMGGGGLGGGFDLADGQVDLASGWAVGGILGIRPRSDEGRLIVLSYQLHRTHFNLDLDDRPPGSFAVDIGYLQIGGEIDGRVLEHLYPFFGVSLGTTHFSRLSSDSGTEWFFSTGFYGGIKVPIGDHFGLRLQGGMMATILTEESPVVCGSSAGGACLSVDDLTGVYQGSAMAGLYVAF